MKAWNIFSIIKSQFAALGIILAGCWLLLPPSRLAHGQTATMTDKGSEVKTYPQTIFTTRKGVKPRNCTARRLPRAMSTQGSLTDGHLKHDGIYTTLTDVTLALSGSHWTYFKTPTIG